MESLNSKLVRIDSIDILENYKIDLLREDLVLPKISGNKYRKLKYNLKEAQRQSKVRLLTFGGAYSNHIAAVAAAGNELGFKTIGVIRGEELSNQTSTNLTLRFAQKNGMKFKFVTREQYREKTSAIVIEEFKKEFGDFYLIPEGGTNQLAVKGCQEILSNKTDAYDYLCVSVGTGGTIAGIIEASLPHQTIIGFSALKGAFQTSEIKKYTNKHNYQLWTCNKKLDKKKRDYAARF